MSGLWALPNNWAWGTTGEVADVIGGGTPSTKQANNFGGEIPWLTPADLSGYDGKYISRGARTLTDNGFSSSGARRLPAGSVLFSSRAPIGYCAIAARELTTNQGFKSFIPHPSLQSDFLLYWLRSAKNLAEEYASGTTFLELSGAKAATLPVPIAPTAEQSRIVAALEPLLDGLEDSERKLKIAKRKLALYRQSLLKFAVDGSLSAEWKRDIGAPDWTSTTTEQMCGFITKGTTPPKTVDDGSVRTVPFLRVTNLTHGGALDLKDKVFVSEGIHRGLLARSIVLPGDVLMNIVGPPLGQVSAVPAIYPEWNVNQAIAIFRTRSGLLNEYLKLVLLSPSTLRWLEARAKTTAGQSNLTLELCRSIPLKVPSLPEQAEIVRIVALRLDAMAPIEAAIDRALAMAAAQRQNILRAAFSGQLVPQDPTDEPASLLLDRIRAQRKASAGQATTRERRPKRSVAA